jgi:hypothetical protein
MELREYQKELSLKGSEILKRLNIVYLAMQVRTGKTATALEICRLSEFNNVLFVTKKKAIKSIETDYNDFLYDAFFNLTVVNDESLHLVTDKFDCVIHDEHHRFGAFPKPNKTAKLFKQKYGSLPQIYLSGTPHPESYSQIFHQFWVSYSSPFKHVNFYKFANEFVNVKERNLGYAVVKDYSDCKINEVQPIIDKYFIRYTQEQSGFETTVIEKVLYCEIEQNTKQLIKQLTKDKFIEGKNEVILGDTAVKLMSKIHQLSSGTIKFESGNSMVIDYSKAKFIREYFKGQKIAIFYKFTAELKAIQEVFGNEITTDLEEFNNSGKSFAIQIVSGREGISLKNAKYLVYYNIDFSAVSYWQSRDRLTTMERKSNEVFWIFSKGGIEDKIYKQVMNKKNFTTSVFRREYGI